MNLNRRQKKLVIVFVVGMMALLVDRLFLRPDGGAARALGEAQGLSEILPPADNLPALESEPPKPEIALRLERLTADDNPDFAGMRNPFSAPKSWLGAETQATERADTPADAFLRKHRLTAVAELGPQAGALVDGNFLALGQQIDGFSLVSIGKRTAVFERHGQRVTLRLVTDP